MLISPAISSRHLKIPEECVELAKLYLSHNQLKHLKIPKECVKLESVNLEHNQLKRLEIPKECVKLRGLYLSNNQLKYLEIPKECVSLQYLVLGNRRIENERGNTFMFISDAVVNKFPKDPAIVIFKNEKLYPSQFPIAKLYQAIMENKNLEELKEIFLSLAPHDRELILQIIQENKPYSNPECQPALRFSGIHSLTSIQIEKAFANPDDFYRAVQQSILKKLKHLPTEQKNAVYGKIYDLAGRPATQDGKWGQTHALENIPRLADALALCGE